MLRFIASYIAKFLHVLGIVLEVRELLAVLFSGGFTSMVSTLSSLGNPWWVIVLVFISTLVISVVTLALILGKYRKHNKYIEVPKILKQMHQRMTKLAYKNSKKLAKLPTSRKESIANDFALLFNLTERQVKILREPHPLGHKNEKWLEKKMRSAMRDNIPNFLERLAALTAGHHIGLEQSAKSDFLYKFLSQQLDNLRPMPNKKINDQVNAYLSYSLGLNNLG